MVSNVDTVAALMRRILSIVALDSISFFNSHSISFYGDWRIILPDKGNLNDYYIIILYPLEDS